MATSPLEMSDEDFAKLNGPPEETPGATAEPVAETLAEPETPGSSEAAEPLTPAEAAAAAEGEEEEVVTPDPTDAEVEAQTEPPAAAAETPAAEPKTAAPEAGAAETQPKETPAEPVVPDYQAGYTELMAPLKANGKTIELKSLDEARALMSMGANYTKKLQDLQPSRKLLLMLENNDLLDEGKLSFLIDLDRKDPAAIKQLIKDAGLDPLDIDTSEESGYQAGSHTVTDAEADFRVVLGDIMSTPTGKETITDIQSNWDQTSREALWKSPRIMTAIHEQRESGVYDQIKSEMDRQITLGIIPAGTPFLDAYTLVGDQLVAAARGSVTQEAPAAPAAPVVVATRAAAPKSAVANSDKADAASPTKVGGKTPKPIVNPLAQSDEDFLKNWDGRL